MPNVSRDAQLLATARQAYAADGFCVLPPVLPADLIARVPAHMQAVLDGRFETGIEPMWKPAADPAAVRVIDQPHVADRTIFELVTQPAIGQAAAAVTGARRVQLWAASLMWKPTGTSSAGKVGWHQDLQYFETMWAPGTQIITAWVAISHVTSNAGPVRFVPGSHRWGLLNQSEFYNPTDAPVAIPVGTTWREVPAVLAPGAFSLHHALTYHGSGPNTSAGPRLGFALHLSIDDARPRPLGPENPGTPYLKHLGDPQVCPILFHA